METIADIISAGFIRGNATPSNIEYGSAIYRRDGITLISNQSNLIDAWAGGLDGTVTEGATSRRRVNFTLGDGTLTWSCTCLSKNNRIFVSIAWRSLLPSLPGQADPLYSSASTRNPC